MSDNLKLIGDLPDDPRISEALQKLEASGDCGMTEAVTQPPVRGLEKYGIKLRPAGLMQSAMLARIMKKKGDVASEFQPFIYIFTLAAPIAKVWESLDILDKYGFAGFMANVHEWFDGSGIPVEVSSEVVKAITETFEISSKLIPSTNQEAGENEIKKNALLGTS